MRIAHKDCPVCSSEQEVTPSSRIGDYDMTEIVRDCPDCQGSQFGVWHHKFCSLCGATTRSGGIDWIHASNDHMHCQKRVSNEGL